MDACFHLACDTMANVNVDQAALYGSVAAQTAWVLAVGDLLP
jgi:hypothetical protein